MTKTNINQYVYVQCHNRDHARCSANGVGCVRIEMVEKSVVLTSIDAKDALIAELIEITEEAFAMETSVSSVERFTELKARAEH